MLKRLSVMLAVLVACVGCDQATKQLVRLRLPEALVHSFWGDLVRLQHTENHGAFLSLGATLAESTRFTIFVVAVGIALLGMIAYLVCKPGIGTYRIVAVSLIAGGGIGNLIDRVLSHGGVTDFLNLGIGPVRTGIFNLADVAIILGAGMLLYRSLLHQDRRAERG